MMKRWKSAGLILFLTVGMLLAGCSSKPYGHYRNDQMIGFINGLNDQEKKIEFDISEWTKRDEPGPAIEDWGVVYEAHVLPSTRINNEAGDKLKWEDLKQGQMVQINPSRTEKITDTPDELIVLSMSNEQLFKRAGLLASKKGSYRTTVIYEDGKGEPFDINDIEKEAIIMLNGGYSMMAYNSNDVLDIKKMFNIEQFPVILVFNTEKLALKTDRLEDAVTFLKAK
ncbi:hypothetical protein AB4Z45_31015 [Paenibacillus sp. MCAF9]|uniref:hypothetical protein n=1 Tax=Paenibacillus sp. MCAF9 TaxID=3233046 RepID=UPI003F97DAAC